MWDRDSEKESKENDHKTGADREQNVYASPYETFGFHKIVTLSACSVRFRESHCKNKLLSSMESNEHLSHLLCRDTAFLSLSTSFR